MALEFYREISSNLFPISLVYCFKKAQDSNIWWIKTPRKDIIVLEIIPLTSNRLRQFQKPLITSKTVFYKIKLKCKLIQPCGCLEHKWYMNNHIGGQLLKDPISIVLHQVSNLWIKVKCIVLRWGRRMIFLLKTKSIRKKILCQNKIK